MKFGFLRTMWTACNRGVYKERFDCRHFILGLRDLNDHQFTLGLGSIIRYWVVPES